MGKALSLNQLQEKYSDRDFEILSMEFRPVGVNNINQKFVTLKCNIDNHIWTARLSDINTGHGCPMCARKKSSETRAKPKGNSFREVRPDLVKHLKYESDADKFTILTRKKAWFICDCCGYEKFMSIGSFVNHGICCQICSDGISIPEKFCINLLKELNVEFESQKIFNWSNNKRYDFYIPSMDMIIETHGIQHYKDFTFGNRTFEEEKENDILKRTLAMYNKISNYVEVDCRYSDLKWLECNFNKALGYFYDLSYVNFNDIFIKSNKSIKTELWEYCNNNLNTPHNEISKIFNLSRSTTCEYIKEGIKLGICFYDYENHKQLTKVKRSERMFKKVEMYDLTMEHLNTFDSLKEAENVTGVLATGILRVCKNINKTAGGYIWKYSE
jgi:hypothetical protein